MAKGSNGKGVKDFLLAVALGAGGALAVQYLAFTINRPSRIQIDYNGNNDPTNTDDLTQGYETEYLNMNQATGSSIVGSSTINADPRTAPFSHSGDNWGEDEWTGREYSFWDPLTNPMPNSYNPANPPIFTSNLLWGANQ